MQRKPGMFLILMVTLFLTIGFQCEEEGYVAIRDIARFEVIDRTTNRVLAAPVSTSSDSLSLSVSLELESFASNGLSFELMSSAWAYCPGGTCMANEIVDIRVFCDKPIYNASANSNLAGLLTYHAADLVEEFSLTEFLDLLPGKEENYYHFAFEQLSLNFNWKPAPDIYTFTVEIEDNNGHVFTAIAPAVEWL